MVSMAGLNFPVHAIRDQISSALNILIHLGRLAGGPRKIVSICEITGMEGDIICMHDIFQYSQKGVDEQGNVFGDFEVCGVRPHVLARLKAFGVEMPPEMFQRRVLPVPKPKEEEQVATPPPLEPPAKKKSWLS